jgi:hypothetical protein
MVEGLSLINIEHASIELLVVYMTHISVCKLTLIKY